jgi:hypothetical protein
LLARETFFDDRGKWYSMKPREMGRLRGKDSIHQVAGQDFFIRRSIDNELAAVPRSSKLIIDYEEFCNAPGKTFQALAEKLLDHGFDMGGSYRGKRSFTANSQITLSNTDADCLCAAYRNISGQIISP